MKLDARNFTRESEDSLVRFLAAHCGRLEQARLTLALESYITLTCPDTPSLARVLARLPKTISAVLDPPNLTPIAKYEQRDEELRAMVRVLGGRIGIVHLKDFRLAASGDRYELPGPLAGVMNYGLFARELQGLPIDAPVVAEHIGPGEYAETRARLLPLFRGPK